MHRPWNTMDVLQSNLRIQKKMNHFSTGLFLSLFFLPILPIDFEHWANRKFRKGNNQEKKSTEKSKEKSHFFFVWNFFFLFSIFVLFFFVFVRSRGRLIVAWASKHGLPLTETVGDFFSFIFFFFSFLFLLRRRKWTSGTNLEIETRVGTKNQRFFILFYFMMTE